MMYKTHIEVAKGTATSVILVSMLNNTMPNSLLQNIRSIPEFLITSGIIYVFTCWGSQYPDMDLPNSKASHANPINKIIAKGLAKQHLAHRSSKTHSIDLSTYRCVGLFVCLYLLVKYLEVKSLNNFIVLDILLYVQKYLPTICISIWLGNVWHIFADYFTQEGAYVFNFLPKVKLVPADVGFGNYKPFKDFFSTGDNSPWELLVRRLAKVYFKISLIAIPIVAILPLNIIKSHLF